ncbi:hypothetical protein, partial [Peribacillus butanolivorans]|uniref:hypothetical protein n=1 Tax=Peribacillus butanolivorans TaxID=421767 RepID=UPI0036DE90CE
PRKIKRLKPIGIQGSSRLKLFYYFHCLLDREQFIFFQNGFFLLNEKYGFARYFLIKLYLKGTKEAA